MLLIDSLRNQSCMFVRITIFIFGLLTIQVSNLQPDITGASESSRPNIILILVDDMGYSDIGAFGSEIDTPNIDALSEQGITFTHFYNSAKCETTRAALMSGLYHQQTVSVFDGGYPRMLAHNNNNVTIAELLGDGGYDTIMSGKWHMGNHIKDRFEFLAEENTDLLRESLGELPQADGS